MESGGMSKEKRPKIGLGVKNEMPVSKNRSTTASRTGDKTTMNGVAKDQFYIIEWGRKRGGLLLERELTEKRTQIPFHEGPETCRSMLQKRRRRNSPFKLLMNTLYQ